jgi:PhzF family phenazine biosynthesis protein
MPRLRLLRLDVFSTQPGKGNPLAVVLDAGSLDAATMQAIARWNRLPETTFVLPPGSTAADYRLHIFSPQHEVPFAGHPSIGTAHALLALGRITPRDGLLWQDGAAGRLPLRVEGDGSVRQVAIRTPRARALDDHATAHATLLSRACAGWPAGPLPPMLAEGGRRWWFVALPDEATLRTLAPDWPAIAALAAASGSMGVCAFAFAAAGQAHDLAVRAFVGTGTPFEDAASGAANAILAAMLAGAGALPGHGGRYRVSQGREVGFDASLHLHVDAEGEVWSGGQACLLLDGWLDWPAVDSPG